jgi:hypothetical protein
MLLLQQLPDNVVFFNTTFRSSSYSPYSKYQVALPCSALFQSMEVSFPFMIRKYPLGTSFTKKVTARPD